MSLDTMSLKFLPFTYDYIVNGPSKINLQTGCKADIQII